MLARGSVLAQQSSPSCNDDDDDVASQGPGRNDEDDNDTCDGSSECDYTRSVELQESRRPSGITLTQQQAARAPGPGTNTPGITQFQQPRTLLEIPQGTGDMNWTSAIGQAQTQTYQGLPTPLNDCHSWFDPFEVSTPVAGGSQPSWSTKSPMDEHYFHNVEPFNIGFLDWPGSGDNPKDKDHSDSNDGNTTWEKEKRGSITLTLSQVDSDVAQEIMGSVLKHSASLKIRCIVNDE